jgi:RND family efflux transporter MFP subunit
MNDPRPTRYLLALSHVLRRLRFSGIAAVFLWTGVAHSKEVAGLVYPLHDLTLSAGVSGLVMTRHVEPGQFVQASQVLITLDDRLQVIEADRRKLIFEDRSELQSFRDRTTILETLLNDARKVMNATGSVSRDEVLRLEAEYVASKGRLDQLVAQKIREQLEFQSADKEKQLRQTLAPVAGVVTRIDFQPGEWAKQGDALLRLVDSGTCVIKLAMPLKEAMSLKAGSAVPVALDTSPTVTRTTGKVTFVSPVADAASGLVEVKVSFSNVSLKVKPGIRATVSVGDGASR